MKVLYAEFTAKPGSAEKVLELVEGLALNVRREPGNVAFDPYRESEDGSRFFIFEAYQDEAAFQAHLGMPYGKPFNDALADLIEEPQSQLTFLNLIAA
ncbi:MAG: putative quinol monooxygenase [Scrofimicrobium sp.]